MKELEERIKKDGIVEDNEVLKVGSFLNHQIDPFLLEAMAKEWKKLYEGERIDKILTIEASGIAMAVFAAREFGCPMVFAKKSKTVNLTGNVYSSTVFSFTHKKTNTILVQKNFLSKNERVLIIDDFLANGAALKGLIDICRQAGAEIVGCGIAIEKAWQPGGDELRKSGIRIESLVRILSMDSNNGLKFI